MRNKLLGRSGLRVSELCLGTMTFGEDWGWGAWSKVSSSTKGDAIVILTITDGTDDFIYSD
jgi:aryl-alcohol dehydrogenase-like predicted oxidoreductase